ncbi:hypothetical protein NM688_g8710 [Phlebia brevispora]|uniref:Uncharacterized protein n=1 Tax=Phlebia brevispora TaxID=194682 RepID=A0ACC1RQ45_9APHY|nr:hypothetical protein NM688_g8710 [Phlebia brevispora]
MCKYRLFFRSSSRNLSGRRILSSVLEGKRSVSTPRQPIFDTGQCLRTPAESARHRDPSRSVDIVEVVVIDARHVVIDLSLTVPTEDELTSTLVTLRAENPTLGTAKLHALLLSTRPDWTVSEKRTKKILHSEGLVLGSSSAQSKAKSPTKDVADDAASLLPVSKLVEGLDIAKWTNKVEVKYFGRSKGKGLVAKELIAEGETVWKEDPFVLAPEWEIYDLQVSSAACAHCSTPLMDSSLIVSCPASAPCTARFCSRLCLSRSATTHPLLCPAQNPASAPLLAFARKTEWMALHALSRCTARILLQEQNDEAAFKSDWEFVRSLAQLGMEERAKGGWLCNMHFMKARKCTARPRDVEKGA